MSRKIKVFAAGSLQYCFEQLAKEFKRVSGIELDFAFGPAGLLKERLLSGEHADIFASANLQHPQTLKDCGIAKQLIPFTGNKLSITYRNVPELTSLGWLDILCHPRFILAMSTPKDDPSGDYTVALLDKIEQIFPDKGAELRHRARSLVGGQNTKAVPQDRLAAEYLISSGSADIFVGYANHTVRLKNYPELATTPIPETFQPKIIYGLALLNNNAQPYIEFLLSPTGQQLLQQYGFLPVEF